MDEYNLVIVVAWGAEIKSYVKFEQFRNSR